MTLDHYRLEPGVEHSIQFSGGRSSGFMLHRILEANGGLPEKARVVFANTGKEHPGTLDFVQQVGEEWGVDIHWVEYQYRSNPPKGEFRHHARRVAHATASRRGEPFGQLIRRKKMLPSPTMRFCTTNLKRQTVWRYLSREVGWRRWHAVVGFRADEGRRYIKALQSERRKNCEVYEGREQLFPMVRAGVTKADVQAFWTAHPFDLDIPAGAGNCDLCFLKGRSQKLSVIRADPASADWWIEQERYIREEEPREMRRPELRNQFTKHHSVAELRRVAAGGEATGQGELYADDALDCQCTD